MNLTENSVFEGNCIVCGKTEYIPESENGKWVCEDYVKKKQKEYEGELESESGCC